jgi:hypothetical protein
MGEEVHMKQVVIPIVGLILLVLGAQGGIRLLFDHGNGGILSWMPGGFGAWLAGYAVLVAAGLLVAGRGTAKAKGAGGRE